ncbi:DNA primase large subunit [Octopus vulgaris]|uniref:DNA primase large subunit n=1 Tax=Octopus vulgaris TaxID=6645 RepID=A0AA36F9Z5_OCTVU|nr:DNA primase large subunit [Octopus vulgaris]
MEIAPKRLKKSSIKAISSNYTEDDAKLSIYNVSPNDDISLQEFEDFAIERVKILKIVESLGLQYVKLNEDYNRELRAKLKTTKIWKEIRKTGRFDHVSHFILRLAYCRSEELRRWFLQQELDLFRYRFSNLTTEEKREFARDNKIGYEEISEQEKDQLMPKLLKCGRGTVNSDYYKVCFTDVLDLVRSRKVYLQRGYAYVQFHDLISLISNHFREHLSKGLAVTCRSLPHLEEDDRLLPLLNNLSRAYLGEDFSGQKNNAGAVTIDMLDPLSRKSFPPCMQQLHQSLRQNHHLRYGGRLQYGLFLKGIGLLLEDALRFWGAELSQSVGIDKFQKAYAYNIRYNYGKEGKRANFTPYSCAKIILSNHPANGDYHGCVFRHTDPALLRQKFQGQGMAAENVAKIVNYVTEGHYQLACMKHFEITQGVKECSFGLQHPNQYFEESQKILNGEVKTNVSSTPVRIVKLSQAQSGSSQRNQTVKSPLVPKNDSNDTLLDDDDIDDALLADQFLDAQGMNEIST